MSKEIYQEELAYRASDNLPFVDSKVIKGVIKTIMVGMYRIEHREGRVVYPYTLSPREISAVRSLLKQNNRGLEERIDAVVPIRLQEGMGTEFLFGEKRKKS